MSNIDDLLADGWHQVGALVDEDVALMSHQYAEPIKTWSTSKGKITSVVIYDYDDTLKEGQLLPDLPPKCPHCQRDWHPEPLTNDVVAMLENHHFRADYDPAADESVIRCVGANYLGPNRYNGIGIQPGAGWPQIEFDTSQLVKAQGVISNILDSMLGFLGIEMPDLSINFSTWFHGLDPKPECDTLPLPIEFGPQNWSITPPGPSFSIKYGHEPACQTVRDLWDEFTAIPMPESPGYDFSEYASETMDYTTIGKGKK